VVDGDEDGPQPRRRLAGGPKATVTTAGTVHAVVTNDDGIGSEGLRMLAYAAVRAGWDVVVAAPDRQASGSGAAMTAVQADGQVVVERHKLPGIETVPAYAVQAAPGFIAFTAVRGAFGRRPDYLLSGINAGPNTGRAVLHSGTVGAAMTAATYGVRAAAFSLDVSDPVGTERWGPASDVALEILPVLSNVPPGIVLNVNIPGAPSGRIQGIRQARLAEGGAVELSIIRAAAGNLHVTVAETGKEPAPGTDSALLAAGYAVVTAIRPVCEVTSADLPWPAG
jgi:5'-nucleotidase